MSAEQRVKKFEDWSREHGRSSRESDRRRVALELFDISHGKRVEPEHVDALAKKYRDGLMGANAILHARAVADDLLAWQEEAGGDADEASSSFAPPPRAVSERPQRHADLPPAKASSIAPPGRSERPPAWQDAALGRHESTPLSRSDVPPRGDRREARRSSEPGAPPPYGISQVARSTAPERKYSEPPAKGRGVASLDSLPPAKPASDDLFDDLDGLGSGDRPISSVPPKRNTPPSSIGPRRAISDAPRRHDSDAPRRSSPLPASRPPRAAPADDFDDFVDKAPKNFKAGFDRSPSMRPQAASPEVLSRGESGDKDRAAQRTDVLTESVAPPPLSVPPKLKIYQQDKKPLSRRLMLWGGLALPVVGLLGFVFTRPACSPFTSSNKPVGGAFRSKHLGVELTFSDQWLHDETKDDAAEKEGWNRRVSIFYRGTSSTDFLSQFVLVVFSRGDRRATTVDANQLGANETMGVVMNRQCSPFKHPTGDIGTICSGMTARGTQRLALIEAYFPLDGRAVFARFLLEVPSNLPSTVPTPDGVAGAADEMHAVLERKLVDATAVLSSIRTLH